MKQIRIGSGAGYAGDRIEPAIDLIRRGSTYSIRLPGAKRNIRLDTVGLPKDLLYSAIGKNRRGEAEHHIFKQ